MGLVPNPPLGDIRSFIYNKQATEYQFFPEEYFSGADVTIYFGDVWLDEVTSLQFMMQENVRPIYGYASYTWDFFARGNRIIEGEFRIAFKEAGYLNSVFRHLESLGNKAKPRLSFLLSNDTIPKWVGGVKDNIDDILWRYNGPLDELMNNPIPINNKKGLNNEDFILTNAGTQEDVLKDLKNSPADGNNISENKLLLDGKRTADIANKQKEIVGYYVFDENKQILGYTKKTEFEVKNIETNGKKIYYIQAIDSNGIVSDMEPLEAEYKGVTMVQTPPSVVSGISVKMVTASQIALTWNKSQDTNNVNKYGRYIVYYRKDGTKVYNKLLIDDFNNNYIILKSLEENTQYEIYITSQGYNGKYSTPSPVITVQTNSINPIEPLVEISNINEKNFSINGINIKNTRYKSITGIVLNISNEKDDEEFDDNATSISIPRYKDNNRYFYSLTSKYIEAGTTLEKISTNYRNIYTFVHDGYDDIVPPNNLREIEKTENSIVIGWSPASGGDGVEKYEIRINESPSGVIVTNLSSPETRFTIPKSKKLSSNTEHKVKIRAIFKNSDGKKFADSEEVKVSFEKKYENIPGAPGIELHTIGTDDDNPYSKNAIIKVTPPANDFGITSYNLYLYEIDYGDGSKAIEYKKVGSGPIKYNINKDSLSIMRSPHRLIIDGNYLEPNKDYKVHAKSVSNFFGDSTTRKDVFDINYDEYTDTESIASNYIKFSTKNLQINKRATDLKLLNAEVISIPDSLDEIEFELSWKINSVNVDDKFNIYINDIKKSNEKVEDTYKYYNSTTSEWVYKQKVKGIFTGNSDYIIYIKVENNDNGIENCESDIIKYSKRPISPSDNISPTTPNGLKGTNITYNSVKLDWSNSTDASPNVYYQVWVGEGKHNSKREDWNKETLYGVINKSDCSIKTLNPNKEYYMYIIAEDYYGNTSAKSNVVQIKTKARPDDPIIPSGVIKFNEESIKYEVKGNSIILKWQKPTFDELIYGKYDSLFVDGKRIRKYEWLTDTRSSIDKNTDPKTLAGSRVHGSDYIIVQLKKRLEELKYDFKPDDAIEKDVKNIKSYYKSNKDKSKKESIKGKSKSGLTNRIVWYSYQRYITTKNGKKEILITQVEANKDVSEIKKRNEASKNKTKRKNIITFKELYDKEYYVDKYIQSRLINILSKLSRTVNQNSKSFNKRWADIYKKWPKDSKGKLLIDGKYGDETTEAVKLFMDIAGIKDKSKGQYVSEEVFKALSSSLFDDNLNNNNEGFNIATVVAVKIFKSNSKISSKDTKIGKMTVDALEVATGMGAGKGQSKKTGADTNNKEFNAGSLPSINGAINTAKEIGKNTGGPLNESIMAELEKRTWTRQKKDSGYNRPYFYRSPSLGNKMEYMKENGFDIYILYGPLAEYIIRGEKSNTPLDKNNNQILDKLPKEMKEAVNFNTTVRAIRNVQIYSMGTIVDASGNPIEEVYRFMARDID